MTLNTQNANLVQQAKELYPKLTETTYTVAGGFCLYVYGDLKYTRPETHDESSLAFPSIGFMERTLQYFNSELTNKEAEELAGAIDEMNDIGIPERAWQRLEDALMFVPEDSYFVAVEEPCDKSIGDEMTDIVRGEHGRSEYYVEQMLQDMKKIVRADSDEEPDNEEEDINEFTIKGLSKKAAGPKWFRLYKIQGGVGCLDDYRKGVSL